MRNRRTGLCWWLVTIGILVLLGCVFFAAYWATNLMHPVDYDVWGSFGDFFGGVYGTIFALVSVALMYVTFKSQREQTHNSDKIQQRIAKRQSNQAELQRFNELFFELLSLYKRSISELGCVEDDKTGSGCNYLDSEMHRMIEEFRPARQYGRSAMMASYRYTHFYLENAGTLAPVFRTLYRIMELIDTARISDTDKLLYAKIVRAQLRESELFFLRYNCMTQYGDNFIEYVNKYRLLKHLPMMSLLEFKSYRERLGNNQSIYLTLNLISRTIWRTLRDVTIGRVERGGSIPIGQQSQRYSLTADMSSPNVTTLILRINIRIPYTKPDLKPLSRLDYADLAKLLENLLSEIYRYSNYRRYNRELPQISLSSGVEESEGIPVIFASISADKQLRLTHPQWDERYGL